MPEDTEQNIKKVLNEKTKVDILKSSAKKGAEKTSRFFV